ncbi:hypothetical protein PR002_g32924 [Phytophthora rubi]|uniref:Secreted protein n=1 Tax=Phytophthora rubi TaxID=129364 RepID=A0A6A3G3L3_9STRA|nr:hypothetical protein PR002_g32924 [Phytophthora rubi]
MFLLLLLLQLHHVLRGAVQRQELLAHRQVDAPSSRVLASDNSSLFLLAVVRAGTRGDHAPVHDARSRVVGVVVVSLAVLLLLLLEAALAVIRFVQRTKLQIP